MRRLLTMKNGLRGLGAGAVTVALVTTSGVLPSLAQDQPAPSSTGAKVAQSYFGPPPSQSFTPGHDQLVGPQQLLRSGTVTPPQDGAGTVTLPLYLGHDKKGANVWYILTDTTDERNANALGLNFSAKLSYLVGTAVRPVELQPDTTLRFDKGRVDFSPQRQLVPGTAPNAFPPKTAHAGSVGDKDYTPYVRITNAPGTPIYNAPVVASDVSADQLNKFCNGNVDHSLVHDRVLKICPSAASNGQGTVTLKTTSVFSFAKPATYISTESSSDLVATLDEGTFAPALGGVTVGGDDSAFSAVERLFVTANGPTGKGNPQRQGLNSALSGEGPPLNVIGGVPNVANDYSPAWDINLGYWTDDAIAKGYRSRVIDEFQILDLVRGGFLTGPDGKRYGSIGILVNCPIIERFL